MARNPRWERIEELYHAALARDASERAAFLQAACVEDDAVRREVESLLAEGSGIPFLGMPALELAGRDLAASASARVGRRIGGYEIRAFIGAGGMGEVYRARDTKLHRDVALKILPGAVTHDPERIARFAREAHLLAVLNHPHLAAIYGLEESDGVLALVLELVEGETLADRIARGPIAVTEAIVIARQIVEGLEAAHERGIIHRDLKPSNIKLRPDGAVKILDFGLAKAIAPGAVGDRETSPHVSPVTGAGSVIGTPAYMSPEQAQGQPVDTRADIWAFGCVFYEMLTGRRTFDRPTATDTFAAVMAAEPDWGALPGTLLPSHRLLLKRCLAKDVKQRLRDTHDVGLALEGAFETDSVSPVRPAATRLTWSRAALWAIAAAVLLSLAGVAGWLASRAATRAERVDRIITVVPVPVDRMAGANTSHVLDVSPDGHIVYAADGALWLRRLDASEATVLSGTENSEAHTPFFSPDGQSIGYYDDSAQKLRRVNISGGQPIDIVAIDRPFGASWTVDNVILYGTESDGIWQVSVANGKAKRIIAVANGEAAHSPHPLPDGRVVFTLRPREAADWDYAQIAVAAPGSTERRIVVPRGRDARYLPTGHLVYASSDDLVVARFDGRSDVSPGTPVSLVHDVMGPYLPFTDATRFAISQKGTLVYVPRRAPLTGPNPLVWVSRAGAEESLNLIGSSARVAPDGTRIASAGGGDLVVADTLHPSWTPIVPGPRNYSPVWSRDSRYIFFNCGQGPDRVTLCRVRPDGKEKKEVFSIESKQLAGQLFFPGAVTHDGRLVFTYGTTITPRLGLFYSDRVGREGSPWDPIERPYNMSTGSLSPRDDWIAYGSFDSSSYHVYIERFPEGGSRTQLDTTPGGGSTPVWSADGTEVFYRRNDGAMMAVTVTTAPTFDVGKPELLFRSDGYGPVSLPRGGGARTWDVARDGRFLIPKQTSAPGDASVNGLMVIQNWFEEVKQRVPAN
jgi:serine/threonine-protein kinase